MWSPIPALPTSQVFCKRVCAGFLQACLCRIPASVSVHGTMQQLQHVQKGRKGNADPPATSLAFELPLGIQPLMLVCTLFKAPHFLRKASGLEALRRQLEGRAGCAGKRGAVCGTGFPWAR